MKSPSPAALLAATKSRNRPKRNFPPASEVVVWTTTLRAHREKLNLSMRDVAVSCGLSVSAYFRIEAGYADVALSNAVRIAEFFAVPVAKLWTNYAGGGTTPNPFQK